MEDDANSKEDGSLAKCEEAVEQLKEENAQLRESAQAFGDLAERLNAKTRVKTAELSTAQTVGKKTPPRP
jgi:hypothetical protein